MLDKLKEYKELISIIVFFLGGFIWVQNQFPTKSDLKANVGALSCLLDKYMTLTQRQLRGRDLERQVQELITQIGMSPDTSSNRAAVDLSPAMKLELDEKKADLTAKRNELNASSDDMRKISEDLARNICGKVTP